MQEERKTLDRELARAKVTANRVATVVANEWKDSNDKVMPVKQWLEERRILQVILFAISILRSVDCNSTGNFVCKSTPVCLSPKMDKRESRETDALCLNCV